MRKTPAEVDALRRAGAAIDRVHAQVAEWLQGPAGPSARSVRDIADAILAEGHATVDFVIVGSGPNGASPHHELSDRVIEPGTRSWSTSAGRCRRLLLGLHPHLRRRRAGRRSSPATTRCCSARRTAACEAVRPGVTAESVDAAAREVIATAGYGELFIHRTGHGIGLETHEEPYIVAGNTEQLEPGMAFSVEPGIYRPGRARRPDRGHRRVHRGPGSNASTSRPASWSILGRPRAVDGPARAALPTHRGGARTCSRSTRRDRRRRSCAAGRRRASGRRRFPARRSAPWAGPGCSACPTRRSTAAAGSPTRSTCRCSRSSPRLADGRARASACTPSPASRWPPSAPPSSASDCCPTCSAASCWAPTACPSPTPARTRRRCDPGGRATATTTWSPA